MKKLYFILFLFTGIMNAQIVNIPNANFKAKLLAATTANQTAADLAGNYVSIDINSDGEIQNTEALLIKSLYVYASNISNLTGIEAFTNLQDLYCYNNQLTSLDLSSNTALVNLNCSNNQINALDISSLHNLVYFNCQSNLLSAINFSGLNNLQTVNCLNNLQLTEIDLAGHTSLTNVAIGSNDPLNPSVNFITVDLSGTSVSTPNISYSIMDTLNLTNCANLVGLNLYLNVVPNVILTGCNAVQNLDLRCILSSLDVTNMVNLQSLNISGSNSIPFLDLSNNINLYSLKCDEYNPETLDLSNNINLFELVCASNNLKYLFIKNGSNELEDNLEWTFGGCPNLLYACVDESQRSFIESLPLFPATVIGTYCSFTPGGNYNTITGTITYDSNNDGCDVSDLSKSNVRVNISDATNSGASFTSDSGQYAFYTQTGNFTITSDIENPAWFSFSPSSATIPFANNNNNTTTQNFCLSANGIHPDIEVVIAPIAWARPGFDAKYQVVYKNKGNQTLSGNITFAYNDAALGFVSSNVIPTSQSTGLLTYDYTNLLPFENRSFYIILHVNSPTDTPAVNIGDQLNFTASINAIAGDENPSDNTLQFNQTVVGSYDPNDISCIEGNLVPPSEIGNYLHYIINFENTGTADAENIVVKDIIDTSQFDVSSLQVLNSSAEVTAKLTGNVAEFIFPSINLHSGGHGNILIKIRSKNTLVQGNMVSKRANIYFDYNAPIDTNLENTTFQALSNSEFNVDKSISVYPNPSHGNVTISCDNSIKSIQLYDIQGRLLQTSLINENKTSVDISNQSNGIYFLKIISEKGIGVEKIVKE